MKKIIWLTLGALLLAGCAVHRYRSDFEFAGKLVKEGLWQEAVYRLEKARAAGNDSAALHNNLAVALEGLGRLGEAQREYEEALKRAPGQAQIQINLDRSRKNLRRDSDEKK